MGTLALAAHGITAQRCSSAPRLLITDRGQGYKPVEVGGNLASDPWSLRADLAQEP